MIRLPWYFRPGLDEVRSKVVIDELNAIKKDREKLAGNMWLIGTRKRAGSRGFETNVHIQSGKKHFIASFPTDGNGVIPPTVMAERIMDLADGDRGGKERNVFVDVAVTAKSLHKPEDKAKSYLWYLYPNEGDIKGVDDANTKLVTILPSTSKARRRSVMLIGGTSSQRDSLAKVLSKNFTKKEQEVLAGVLFHIEPIDQGAAGMYQRARVIGAGGSMAVITVDPHYANDEGANVIVHEAIHALRDKDVTRLRDLQRKGETLVGTDKDLEESLTEAETVGRENPLKSHEFASRGGGYYPRLGDKVKGGRTTQEVVIDDRIKLTRPKDKLDFYDSGKRGKRVQKLLVKTFPDMDISKLRLHGKAEAIDTYWEMQNKRGQVINTHVYKPGGKVNPELQKGEISSKRFDDGKSTTISKRSTPRLTPRMPRLR
tara:strand:- start:2468 stop:3754 length:1287 start_codon:yes stop_codon:yes gene_type:complete